MKFIRTEALSYTKADDRFRAVVLNKCREFYFMEIATAELKAECVAVMMALGSPLPVMTAPVAPVHAPVCSA
jgi:hypothetical protein